MKNNFYHHKQTQKLCFSFL